MVFYYAEVLPLYDAMLALGVEGDFKRTLFVHDLFMQKNKNNNNAEIKTERVCKLSNL